MNKEIFFKNVFSSEKARNAYMFQNKDRLIGELNKKRRLRIFWGIVLGTMLVAFFAEEGAWWTFIFLFVTPAFLYYMVLLDIRKIEKYSQSYEQFLIEIEESARDILKTFNERYFVNDQRIEHISDLINLINHKKALNLSGKDGLFLLTQYGKESNFRLYDEEILKSHTNYRNISHHELAKILIKFFPETDFQNEEDYRNIFDQFCEFLNKKNIEYNNFDLKKELTGEYVSSKAVQFEQKLNRGSEKNNIATQIEHLNGFEFEQFLGELFKKAGYKVIVTKKSGDQGADLIVEKNGISTAIQAKKYIGSVGNSAVQEVVAAMKYYDCDKSMVITTGSFTKGAYALASRNGVQLIGSESIDDLFEIILRN